MSADTWTEDENHRTINGERWVAREADWCHSDKSPGPNCEMLDSPYCTKTACAPADRKDHRGVRWYRADSPALAFFDKPKEDASPEKDADPRPIAEICMDSIRSSLRTLIQDRDRKAVDALRDSQAASLDARVKTAMDAMLTVPDSFATPAPAPEDDVEIIIDPTPEQVPEGSAWGCWWDTGDDNLGVGRLTPYDVQCTPWEHLAILVRGHLSPSEMVARVRKMLAEKEGK